MSPRTVGVEEELWLVEPTTRRAAPRAPEVLRAAGSAVEGELFRHQLETKSEPAVEVGAVVAQLREARATAGVAAADAGLAVVASGTVVLPSDDAVVTDDERYRDMVDRYGETALGGGTCGMHVHVRIASAQEGVQVIDRIAPWLPLVLALSVNSPFVDGRDTGYASWRSEQWSHWPSAGPTVPFVDVAGYHRAAESLVRSGAARDTHMLYYDARLAELYPTVEVRVADVVTDLADVALVAAVVRGLVETAARDRLACPTWRTEMLRAARWRAARFGLGDRLLHPARPDGEPVGAVDVLHDLRDSLVTALEDAGDLDLVDAGLERVVGATGAVRQRAALGRDGDLAAVVDDLVVRTRASWEGDCHPER